MCDAKLEEIERVAAAVLAGGGRPRTSSLVPFLEARGYCRAHVISTLDGAFRAGRLRAEGVPPGVAPTSTPEALWSHPAALSADAVGNAILHEFQTYAAKLGSSRPTADNRRITLFVDEYPAEEYPGSRGTGAPGE
jgi:hypothetical protein